MSKEFQGTPPGLGYTDIPHFLSKVQFVNALKEAQNKKFSEGDPLEGRAYLVMKEMPDARVGTVLRPTITIETGELTTGEWSNHYGYWSKYHGRQSFLHMEIVHAEKDWFWRIN